MASKHQEIDTDSGRATKADMAAMRREAREREEAYRQGVEDSGTAMTDDSDSGGSFSRSLPSLQGIGNSFSLRNDSQKLILVSMTATGIVSVIETIHGTGDKNPHGSIGTIVVGTFVSGAILLGMSYFLPEFASGLAVIVLLVTVLEKGKPFWDVVRESVGKPPVLDPSKPVSDTNVGGENIILIPGASNTTTSPIAPTPNPVPTTQGGSPFGPGVLT